MARIERFWDLGVWQEARKLNKEIYDHILSNIEVKDFAIKDQMNRSAGSVMDNIAEGFGRGGRKEFIQFLSYSKGSIDEVQSQLFRCKDRSYISNEEYEKLFKYSDEIASMIVGFSRYLQKSEIKGAKYMAEEPLAEYLSYKKELH